MVACIYMVDGPSMAVLTQLAQITNPPQNALDIIANQLLFLVNKFEGVHSRKVRTFFPDLNFRNFSLLS